MEKQMVQCEDGRRRQARIHGLPTEEGDFRVWKAGVRLKGKHVSGEAWYSYQTKTWYFITDLEGKHSHLMDRISDTLRGEKVRMLRDQLKQLESRQTIEQKKLPNIARPWKLSKAKLKRSKTILPNSKKGSRWNPAHR